MYKRILVPLDGSELAEKALPFATAEAKAHGASLVLLRVVHPVFFDFEDPVSEGEQVIIEKERDQAGKYLDEVVKMLSVEGLEIWEEIGEEIGEGEIAEVIITTAKADMCDLICMSTHGFSGRGPFAWSRVTDKVAKASEVPLLLIHTVPVSAKEMETEARVRV